MVESIIRDLSTQWQAVDTFTAKGLAVVIARDWTLVVHHDGSSI